MRWNISFMVLATVWSWVLTGWSCSSEEIPVPRTASVSVDSDHIEVERYVERASSEEVLPTTTDNSPGEVSVEEDVSSVTGFYQLESGDTIYGVAKRLGISWQELYQLNKHRLRGECLERFDKKRCGRGRWQYHLEVGDYVELPKLWSVQEIARVLPVKKQVTTLASVGLKFPSEKVAKKTKLSGVNRSQKRMPVESYFSSLRSIEKSLQVLDGVGSGVAVQSTIEIPSIPEVAVEPGQQNGKKPLLYEDMMPGGPSNPVLPLEQNGEETPVPDSHSTRADEVQRKLPVFYPAKRAHAAQGEHLVYLKIGSLSLPFTRVEDREFNEKRVNPHGTVEVFSTSMFIPLSQDCIRPRAWLRL